MKLSIALITVFLLVVSSISAMSISFYYSETCSYCQEIKPLVFELADKYPEKIWGIYDIANPGNYESYNGYGFTSVPAFVINTDDNREIQFVGANSKRLKCEVEEMTTKECPTYAASETCIDGSWFIN